MQFMKSRALRCSMSECVVVLLLTLETDLLKLAKSFAKLLDRLFIYLQGEV